MEAGDVVQIVEYKGSHQEAPSKLQYDGKIGLLLKVVCPPMSTDWGHQIDWGALWAVILNGEGEVYCYEGWMEVISGI